MCNDKKKSKFMMITFIISKLVTYTKAILKTITKKVSRIQCTEKRFFKLLCLFEFFFGLIYLNTVLRLCPEIFYTLFKDFVFLSIINLNLFDCFTWSFFLSIKVRFIIC